MEDFCEHGVEITCSVSVPRSGCYSALFFWFAITCFGRRNSYSTFSPSRTCRIPSRTILLLTSSSLVLTPRCVQRRKYAHSQPRQGHDLNRDRDRRPHREVDRIQEAPPRWALRALRSESLGRFMTYGSLSAETTPELLVSPIRSCPLGELQGGTLLSRASSRRTHRISVTANETA
jgi:hypothetical protein